MRRLKKSDYETALKKFKTTAEKGDVKGYIGLGLVYYMKSEYEISAYWFTLAANEGIAEAQFLIGTGVIQSYVKAHMWLNIAAMNGHESALSLREILDKEITAKQLEQAQELAINCKKQNYENCNDL